MYIQLPSRLSRGGRSLPRSHVLPCPQTAGTGKPKSLQAVQGVHKGAAWLVQAVSNRGASVTKTEDFEKSHAKSPVFLQTFHVLGVFDLYYRVSVVNI